jgi:hypothetical protein
MKTGFALFSLIGLSMVFDVDKLWPSLADIKPGEYTHIALTQSDSVKAIESYRKTIYLDDIGYYKDFFPLSNKKLAKKMHAYYIVEKVILCMIAFLWIMEATAYSKPFVLMFLFFLIGDLADYLIIYNENYNPYLSYNILFTVLYAFFLMFMGWKHR